MLIVLRMYYGIIDSCNNILKPNFINMKNQKLSLKGLKVQSFVTDLQVSAIDTIKGGVEGLTAASCNYRSSERTMERFCTQNQ